MLTPQKVVFIVGPTAVGKSSVGLALAQQWGGEIVSCDAMQVYREVVIASNKPSPDMLAKVPHHLVGIVSVTESFDVASYNRLANEAIVAIQGRGKIPIVVGGSGLYMQVLLDGIFSGSGRNENLRREIENRLRQEGADALYEELKRYDPTAAQKIHPNDVRRLVRALEVCQTSVGSFTEVKQDRVGIWGKQDVVLYCLDRNRDELYGLINARVDEMFAQGLVEEIRQLKTLALSPTANAIIGIKEVGGYLAGAHDVERAKYLMKLNTRHYAKRQLTWFRKEKRLQRVDVIDGVSPEEIASQIVADLRKR